MMPLWIIAPLPFGLALGAIFDVTDWELWALFLTACWWRSMGPKLNTSKEAGK